MKKLLPLIILLVMGAMLMISWSNIADAKTEVAAKYKTLLQQAERFEEKKIYTDAIENYNAALKIKPEYNLALRVAGLYQEINDDKGYLDTLDTAISCDPTNPDPYFSIIKFYQKAGDSEKLYGVLNRAKDALKDSDRMTDEQWKYIKDLLKKLNSEISVYSFGFKEFYGFHRYEGRGTSYAKVFDGTQYGLIKSDMGEFVSCSVDDISFMNGGLIPILKNGEYYCIDGGGNRKIVPDSKATAFGAYGGGVAPIQANGKYGYIDTRMNESHFDYEFAGSFENGIAPVKQDGKWFVINMQYQPVGPNFDEILIDAFGFCAPYGVYFGRSGNSWGMYSTAGEKIADGFEEVKQFASTQPTAVKKDGKWIFISLSGETVLETEYANAGSFSLGYAPVQKGDLWGCINQEGEMLIDPQFKQLDSFNESGYAYGENAEGSCTVIIHQYH